MPGSEGSSRPAPVERRREAMDVDTTGAPVIVQCPATGCEDLDLSVTEDVPGITWIVRCGSGHVAALQALDEEIK